MAHLKHILPAAAVALLLSGPSLAAKPEMSHGHHKISRAAPGPVAGVGLPVAAAYGAFLWYRLRKSRKAR